MSTTTDFAELRRLGPFDELGDLVAPQSRFESLGARMNAEGLAVTEAGAPADDGIGESRWPPAVAVVVFMVLNIAIRIWLPNESAVRVPFLVPAIEGMLLLVLLVHPARHNPRRPWVRPVAVTLVLVLVLAARRRACSCTT